MTSGQPHLSQQPLVRFMSLLIVTTLTQLFDSDFPHCHQQGLHRLSRLPCCNVQSALPFTTAAGDVCGPFHHYNSEAIVCHRLLPSLPVGLSHVIESTTAWYLIKLVFYNSHCEVTQGQRTKNKYTHELWEGGDGVGLGSFECKPKESSNGEPLGAGLQTIYTTVHEGCARLSIGLCTVQDIIVELGARLLTSRVAACTARGTGLGYCRTRCTDKILRMIR